MPDTTDNAKLMRWITMWSKTGDQCFDWDFHVSDIEDDVPRVVANLKKQNVIQYSTYVLGDIVPEHSDDFSTPPKQQGDT